MDKRKEKIQSMFGGIAGNYDLANEVLSLRVYRSWYKKLLKKSDVKNGMNILDVATGTGNLAFLFKDRVGEQGTVTGLDYTAEMLDIARKKAHEKNMDIRFDHGDALQLPYEDNSFDIVTISFGVRNVESVERCLSEMARVCKPGGKVIVLEFGQPKGFFKFLFKIYSLTIIPLLGKFLTGDKNAYKYLADSSAAFPCREDFITLMDSLGQFNHSSYQQLTFGISYLYVGVKAVS